MNRTPDHFDAAPDELVCRATNTDSHDGPVNAHGLCVTCQQDEDANRADVPAGHNACDFCTNISELYEEFPFCQSCMELTCPDCAAESRDVDGRLIVTCKNCVPCRRCDGEGTIEVGYGNSDTSHPEACPECGGREQDGYDSDYERAASRARWNDFEDSPGRKDWT